MSKKIIAFVGMPGAGKGTCADYLEGRYNWPIVHFGNMVYEEVQRRGLDNVADEKFVRKDMRDKEGLAVLAKHAATRADELLATGNDVVLFDGLYSWSEYKYLSERYHEMLVVIAITAPRALRHERILRRKDGHRKYTNIQQIIDREISEIEDLEKGGPIAIADYTLVNTSSKDDLITQLEQTIAAIQA
jgi:dephospho-CoA kinase